MRQFRLINLTGVIRDDKRKSDFTRSLERLLNKYCDGQWEYNWGDEGMWG